jgi:hypothetical protein
VTKKEYKRVLFSLLSCYDSIVIRRLCGAATWVLMLHLNLVASDLVCARRHERTGAATSITMHHHGPSHVAGRTDTAAHGGEPCKVPARADCCRLLASCSVTTGLGAAAPDASQPITRSISIDAVVENPTSLARAPEPPPPKA